MGLPLAFVLVNSGFKISGIDANESRINNNKTLFEESIINLICYNFTLRKSYV